MYQRGCESISLDFISALPLVGDMVSILVVFRFSKYATFILALRHCSAKQVVGLISKNVLKYSGMQQNIVTNHGQVVGMLLD